jgi:hypothetical protein
MANASNYDLINFPPNLPEVGAPVRQILQLPMIGYGKMAAEGKHSNMSSK